MTFPGHCNSIHIIFHCHVSLYIQQKLKIIDVLYFSASDHFMMHINVVQITMLVMQN